MAVIFSKRLRNLSQASMLRNVSLASMLSVFLAACQIPEEAPEVMEDKPAQSAVKEEKNKATLRGYIDKEGKWAIQPQFITAGSFSEGLAHVVDPRGSYIDKKGNFVIKETYYLGGDFHEGLAWAAIPKNRWSDVNLPGDQLLYGYIDRSGKFVIKPQFRSTNDFSDGMAMVIPPGEQKWGFINKSGKMQIKPQFEIAIDDGNDRLPQFKNGLAYVSVAHNKSFTIDKNGKMADTIRVNQGWLDSFPDNRFPVRDKKGKYGGAWGYIDKKGTAVIRCIYDKADQFSDGLARVRIEGNKWGFIDKAGKTAIAPTRAYEFLQFHEGLCQFRVREGQAWGFMDKTGKIAIEPKFPNAESFNEGLAAADWPIPEERLSKIKLPFEYSVQGNAIIVPVKFSDSKTSSP